MTDEANLTPFGDITRAPCTCPAQAMRLIAQKAMLADSVALGREWDLIP